MQQDGSFAQYERWLWPALWLVIVITGLTTRGYFPIDETRYLGVAWEMWLSGDWLVPHMNGEPYSDKPPLLFWLIVSGWKVFGVNAWWPRLVPSLFAFGSLALTRWIGKRLWSGEPLVANAAPLLLHGAVLWALFSTLLMFDMLVVFFVLVALAGIIVAAGGSVRRGWLLTGLATGLALISKGPVVLLYILPPALATPWWANKVPIRSWSRWYVGLIASLVLGLSIVLAWAVPAALAGGPEYAEAILWGQIAGRIAGQAVPHARPVWWYLAMLPAFLFPWLLWPPLWRGLARLTGVAAEGGVRFCVAWLAPAFVVLTLIESKQPQYLLPLFPAFALLAVRGLARLKPGAVRRWEAAVPASGLVLLGIALAVVPLLATHVEALESLQGISVFWGVGLLLSALGLLAFPVLTSREGVAQWSAVTVALLVTLHLGPLQAITANNDMRPLGRVLWRLQGEDTPIAWLHAYNNQVQFAGRLTRPLDVIGDSELSAWIVAYPDGVVVIRYATWDPSLADFPIYAQRYRGGAIAVWQARYLVQHPELVRNQREG